jgi:hypothetical protein
MTSDTDLPHHQQPPRSFKLLKLVTIITAIILITLVAGSGGYLLGIRNNQSTPPSQPSPSLQAKISAAITQPSYKLPTPIPTGTFTSGTDVPTMATSWKTFTAPMEGFTLRYPNTWRVEDQSLINCGYKYNTGLPNGRGSYCKDSFDFVAPDGLELRYTVISDESNDRAGCGTQSVCAIQHVDAIETLNVNGLEDVLLVKSGKSVALHKPIDSGTIPVVGENKHSNYMISFTLPTKAGGRFSLFFTPFYSPKLRDELTNEQYYRWCPSIAWIKGL